MRCSFRAVSSDILIIYFSFTPVFQTWNMENTEFSVKKYGKTIPKPRNFASETAAFSIQKYGEIFKNYSILYQELA